MKSNTKAKIYKMEDLLKVRACWKNANEKVVFSNGCFDILHLGHVDYLEKAANLGERMIIGLNTDASVSKLKGPGRPINTEYARARLLASLEFVDAIILFGEETPLELITEILPDILVKGNDYAIENIVGAKEVIANGGEVKTISLVEGFSTTNIITKIQKSE
ncbi:MAG: D-glycero-beta-D-manno-heptose 1-phosphate adenylyltransferase [Flammeovirgaceae bacterium]|nr:D-glycero-beta-D-manno-heptose 1-phosphate adenylyltransferase [Flammeovirgaceae bacterium]